MDFKDIGGEIPWTFSFDDHFHSLNSRKNTKELAAIARRHGFDVLCEQYTNVENNLKWSNAGVFFTNKIIDSDLTERPRTAFHNHHHHTFCYLCSINQDEHEHTKPRDESKRRKLNPYINPKARSSSSLDRIGQNPSLTLSDSISYRFIIRTGTQKNSGTRAQVFLYMYGTEKDWTSIHLQRNNKQNFSGTTDGFPSGSVRTFCLKGPDIGQLHHLNVNLVGSRSDKEWFLKEIEITNLNTSKTWLCEFNCWLPKTNEQEVHQIKSTIHQQIQFSLSIYILQIRTGDKAFAGTDANVQIIICGSKNQTRRIALTSNRANLFEQNQLDTFAIVGSDLGDLLEIIVESDRSQFATDWDIKEMSIWKIIPSNDQENSQIYFPFNTWLGKKVSTLKSKREIYPSTDHHPKGPISYQVIIRTGRAVNAGTDANVFLIIYGKSGRTIIHQLNNRLKNDFERNSTSEFTIMDIDIGKIDRIKIWHDNSSAGSAWFLDTVIVRKKYSTSQIISTIYIQRLEEISKALHRQVHEQIKTNRHTTSPIKGDDRRSMDRQSLRSNDYDDIRSKDRLGSSRGILRSPTMYDKISLQKRVRWDEQSIGSQDDLLSINSQRSPSIEQRHRKEDMLHHQSGHFDYQAYWISSHNCIDNKWKIQSIEEINSFDFDQSTRSFLLSDRIAINNKIKTSGHENDADEIYEFQANRWLAKDKEDGKLEVYLTGKLIHKSSTISDASKNSKNIRYDDQRQGYLVEEEKKDFKQSKFSSPYDLGAIERSPKSLPPHELRSSTSRLPTTSRSEINDSHSFRRNIDPSSRPRAPLEKQDAILRSSSSDYQFPSSMLSTQQRSKSFRNMNNPVDPINSKQDLLARLTGESSYLTRSDINSEYLKPSRNINEREPLARILNEPSNYSRLSSASISSSNQYLKSSRIMNERDSLTKLSDQPPHYPRTSTIPSLSSDRNIKSPRDINDITAPLINTRDSLVKTTREPSINSRSTVTSMPSTSQSLKSSRNTKEFNNPLTSERELLARITGEPSYRSQSPATSSLTPLNQRIKSPRNTDDLINSLMSERNTLAKISHEPVNHPRSSVTPPSLLSNQLSKPIRLNNESSSSLARSSIEPPLRPKTAVRSNPKPPLQNSIYDQVYNSAYGTAPSDDF